MTRFLPLLLWLTVCIGNVLAQRSETVSWTIGKPESSLDGGAAAGPVTFTWTFNRPVQHGVYLDGTPWVIWEEGLQLIAASPSAKKEDLLLEDGSTLPDAVADATCINLGEDRLPLDQRMGGKEGDGSPWGSGAEVWDGNPVNLAAGDCIATGHSRRDARKAFRKMIFNAIGVCNVVSRDMTGHYRPPIRMPRELRAALVTPKEVNAGSLPAFEIAEPLDWRGNPVSLDLGRAVGRANPDADDLLNGPIANCGLYSHVWYEPGNGTLNHDLSGKDDAGYQRNVSDRLAACLYTAFDPQADPAKRQRSLNKFIQAGLDYYYMHSLGYEIWNGGGGHPNGVEGVITLAGALLKDAAMTDAIKFQRFRGEAVGEPGKIHDMIPGAGFARSEAAYTVRPAEWLSGSFVQRESGSGAANLEECYTRIDLAREDLVLNNRQVPYTKIGAGEIDPGEPVSTIAVDPEFVWPMYAKNSGSAAKRSYRYIPGAVLRLEGDPTIRKILDFRKDADTAWTEASWDGAGGRGGVLFVHPPLTAETMKKIKPSGSLTTGVCSRNEARNDEIVLWHSWTASDEKAVREGFFATPTKEYLDIKLGDHFYWLPYYSLLDDPGAPGKKLREESATYRQVKDFVRMQRDFGTYFWNLFANGTNLPASPTLQALIRQGLLDGRMADTYCKTYDPADQMWTDPAK